MLAAKRASASPAYQSVSSLPSSSGASSLILEGLGQGLELQG